MDQLQELDREFDVPQATLAQFDLPIRLRRWDVVLDPSTHRLGVGHEVVTSGGRPHEGSNRLEIVVSDSCIPGHETSLEEGLELPSLGPPLVVGAVTDHGADQGPLLAFGTKGRVDLPQGAGRGHRGAEPHDARREVATHGECLGLVVTLGGFAGEDHVDVTDVVEFPAAGLAHGDDREPGRA